MRQARLALVGLTILLVAAGCGSGLTDAQRTQCNQSENYNWVWNVFRQNASPAVLAEIEDLDEDDLGCTEQSECAELAREYMQKHFPSEFDRACKAAFPGAP